MLKDYHQGLLFQQIGFEVTPPSEKFSFRIFDRHTQLELINTKDEDFLAMSHYMQIGFKLPTRRLFGFGERTRDFQLSEGTYSIYSAMNDDVVDDGQPGKEGMGQHPFLMAQLRNATFFGVYINNANAQQITIRYSRENVTVGEETEEQDFAHITFTAIGGILDMFFFTGPGY
jgi:alpha-glucosidase (family GH31 glycosyl hydrolase)